MASRKILVSQLDIERLRQLVDSRRLSVSQDQIAVDNLESELDRALVVPADEIPDDVVTMNSRVRVRDLDTGKQSTYQIVFPQHADITFGRISVLAPIGTALLGHCVGDEIEWDVPSGTRRFRILKVEYQPESARTSAGKARASDEARTTEAKTTTARAIGG